MTTLKATRILLDEYRRWGTLTDDVLLASLRRLPPSRRQPLRAWKRLRIQLTREGRLQPCGRYAHKTGYTLAST